jgi:hypothetical protein
MPTARGSLTSQWIANKLYVTGGYDGNSYLNVVEMYDPAVGYWTTLAAMNVGRSAHVSGAVNGILYVTGGRNPNNLNSVEMYNPGTNKWTVMNGNPMPTSRSDAAAVIVDSRVSRSSYGKYIDIVCAAGTTKKTVLRMRVLRISHTTSI